MDAKEYITSKPDTTGPKPSLANRGDRVRLAEFDNGDEVIPEQDGVVLSVDWHGNWGDKSCYMYVVEVTPDPNDPSDDGLRECGEEQIKEKLA